MARILWLTAPLFAALALAAAACGDDEEATTPAPSPTTAASPTVAASPSPSGGEAIEMELEDFAFNPSQLQVKAGQAVTFDLKNRDSASHTFTIDELNVDETLAPDEEKPVTFTPTGAGALTFYCRFHRSSGMEGTLSVAAASSGLPGY